jgi:hypothetical protein
MVAKPEEGKGNITAVEKDSSPVKVLTRMRPPPPPPPLPRWVL